MRFSFITNALQDRLLLDALHFLILDDAAESIVLWFAVAEINTSGHGDLISDGFFGGLVAVVAGQAGLTLARHNQ